MMLIVDTNIIVAGLIKDAITRQLLIHPDLELYTPEFTLVEIKKHKNVLLKKSRLGKEDFSILFEGVISKIIVVPIEDFKSYISKANDIMEQIDVYDIPFLALALSFDNDGIWSHDKDFEKQDEVKIWKTMDLIEKFIK